MSSSLRNINSPSVRLLSLRTLAFATNLNRKKSVSVCVQKNGSRFLTVPKHRLSLRRSLSDDNINRKSKSYENLRRIATETSLQIPEDFSFTTIKIETYKIRWALLLLVVLYTCISYMQWIQYSIIANIIMEYYGVSYVTVDWLSLIFMVTYVIFIFPVSYFMDCKVRKKKFLYYF